MLILKIYIFEYQFLTDDFFKLNQFLVASTMQNQFTVIFKRSVL